MAADSGEFKYISLYGELCETGCVFKSDKPEALKYYKILADNGSSDHVFKVGKILLHGDEEIPENKMEALKNINMAIQMDHIEAIELYCEMLRTGDGVPIDKKEAEYYANKANELKDPDFT